MTIRPGQRETKTAANEASSPLASRRRHDAFPFRLALSRGAGLGLGLGLPRDTPERNNSPDGETILQLAVQLPFQHPAIIHSPTPLRGLCRCR